MSNVAGKHRLIRPSISERLPRRIRRGKTTCKQCAFGLNDRFWRKADILAGDPTPVVRAVTNQVPVACADQIVRDALSYHLGKKPWAPPCKGGKAPTVSK